MVNEEGYFGISNNNIHVEKSSHFSKGEFRSRLRTIRELSHDADVMRRSQRSMELEWAVHKALYGLGIARSRTESVDLNYPQKWYIRAAYAVFGALVWPFIK